MSNVIQLVKGVMTTEQALDTCKGEEHVIVIGISGHQMTVSTSGTPSVYEIIGLLERAKNFMVDQAECTCDGK